MIKKISIDVPHYNCEQNRCLEVKILKSTKEYSDELLCIDEINGF